MKQLAVILSLFGVLMLAVAEEAKTPEANRTEAARFFEEYQAKLKEVASFCNRRGPEWDVLDPLLDSACALDPENPRYRREAIVFALSRVHDTRIDWSARLETFRKFIEQADEFFRKYPDFRRPFFSYSFPVHCFEILPVSGATEEERRELSTLFDRIRVLHDREQKESDFYRGKLDLSDGVGSERELSLYQLWIRDRCSYSWYYDTEKLVRDSYRCELEFYRAMRDFLQKHPEARRKKLFISNVFLQFEGVNRDRFRREETIAELKRIFSDFDEMSSLMREVDYRPVTLLLSGRLAVGELLRSGCSDAGLREAAFHHFDRIRALPSPPAIESVGLEFFAIEYLTQDNSLYDKILRLYRDYRASNKEEDTFELFMTDLNAGLGAGDMKRIARFLPDLQKSELNVICSNAFRHGFERIGFVLWEGKASAEKRKRLEELNSSFSVRALPFPKRTCMGAVEMDGQIYLLFDDDKHRFHIARFAPATMALVEMPDPGLKGLEYLTSLFRRSGLLSFSASDGRLIVGGWGAVALFDVKSCRWTLVEDLPGNRVVSAVIVDGRCYCLSGGLACEGGLTELLSMCSFRLDGSDRKIHFSARRAEKVTPLDSMPKGQATRLIALPDGKLMFGTVFFGPVFFVKNATLWSFDPKTEQFEKFHSFEKTCDMSLRDQGDFVLGNCYGFGERFFKFDKKNGTITWFLAQSKSDTKWANANGVRQLKGWQELKEPLLLDGKFLISAAGTYCPLVLDLEHPEESPLLLASCGVGIFKLEDGSWIFVGQKQLSSVRLLGEAGK